MKQNFCYTLLLCTISIYAASNETALSDLILKKCARIFDDHIESCVMVMSPKAKKSVLGQIYQEILNHPAKIASLRDDTEIVKQAELYTHHIHADAYLQRLIGATKLVIEVKQAEWFKTTHLGAAELRRTYLLQELLAHDIKGIVFTPVDSVLSIVETNQDLVLTEQEQLTYKAGLLAHLNGACEQCELDPQAFDKEPTSAVPVQPVKDNQSNCILQ